MKSGEKAGRGCGVLGVGGGFVVGRGTEGRVENTAGKCCTRCINRFNCINPNDNVYYTYVFISIMLHLHKR